MIDKLEQDLLSIIDENLETIMRLQGFIVVVVDQENPETERLICVTRDEFNRRNLEDAYDILDAVKVRLFKKSYVVSMPRTKLLYMNLSSISKFIDEMDRPLDQIGYGRPLQGGRLQVGLMTIGWKNDPVDVLRNIYGYCRDFVMHLDVNIKTV